MIEQSRISPQICDADWKVVSWGTDEQGAPAEHCKCIAAMAHFAQITVQSAVNTTSWNSALCKAFQCGDEFALGNKREDSLKGQFSLRSVCHISHSPLTHICWLISYSTAAKQGPAQLYQGRILLSANVKGGEKSMPAYLVCCHTTGTAVRSVLFHEDTDAWADWKFYAAGCLVNGFTYPCSMWGH